MNTEWYVIDLPYAYYAIGCWYGTIMTVPPICRWAHGNSIESFTEWVLGKNGTITLMNWN